MAETKTITLPKEVFDVAVNNHELLRTAYDSYLANARTSAGRTKRRGEVRGGGKKPWKQKGTGRARFGSSRNPIWRGGGIVFGPLGNENYTKKLSVGAKRHAVRQALTLANKAKKIVTITSVTTSGKTKDIVKLLADHKLENSRRVLLVVDEKTPELIRATNNMQAVELIRANYLNVYHLLNADSIIMTNKAIDVTKQWLAKEAN